MPFPLLNLRSSVECGIPVFFDAEFTDSPAASRAFRVLSATTAAYSVLSMWTTLMPIWAVRKFRVVPISALTMPLWVYYAAHMDMNEAVAKAIGAERTISGMTVRTLSEAAGIPERSLMRILQSEREIKVNQVAQIAEALRLYPHEIIEHAEVILERAKRDAPTLANVVPLRQTDYPAEEERAAAKETKTVKRRRDDAEFFE